MMKSMVISVTFAACALAQTDKVVAAKQKMADELAFGPIGITAALAGPMSTTAGAPYSAQAVTQRIQVLADGNRIVQTTTNNVARDGQGRVRREESLPGFAGKDGSDGPHLVLIEDPVAGVHITLDAANKTAFKMPFGQMKAGEKAAAENGVPPVTVNKTFFISSGQPGMDTVQTVQLMKLKTTAEAGAAKADLGTQMVEGVNAHGTKLTQTIPAGQVGNEMPITITTETWYSPDLKVLVMSKSDDPRMGETTYKLTNIQRAEPDATLFQVPEDYAVKDKPMNTIIYKELKKN
jgi:hypothetical protein